MRIINLVFIILLTALISGCNKQLPLDKDLAKKNYNLVNQDSAEIIFPQLITGNITVMGFIYTHCPDICPMTTHNMYLAEEKLHNLGIDDIKFVLLSFDPERDKPSVLKKFAKIRELNSDNWILLTGNKKTINDLLRRFDVKAFPTDSVFYEDGSFSYSMMHTDRISLIDEYGVLKKNYRGSTINIDELIEDIKYLGDY